MKNTTKLELEKMEEKYCSLVWYARKRPEDFAIKGVEASAKSVEFLYPEEVNELHNGHSDWQHGFNSGMLAATRFFMEAEVGNINDAIDNFPELDT